MSLIEDFLKKLSPNLKFFETYVLFKIRRKFKTLFEIPKKIEEDKRQNLILIYSSPFASKISFFISEHDYQSPSQDPC